MKLSINNNDNYLCRVVKIDNIHKHPNADKLQIVTIDGANAIVGLDTQIGDVMIYCPTECCLSSSFLAINNLFENKELNADKEKKGYVCNSGRVKAIKLRGELSRAVLFYPQALFNWLDSEYLGFSELVGVEFDTVDGKLFSKKYVPIITRTTEQPHFKERKGTRVIDRLIEGQFHFHIDTPQLVKNIKNINDNDYIQITSKLHGTSGIAAYVLVNPVPKWWHRLFKPKPQYEYICSSRTSIRNNDKDSIYYRAFENVKAYLTKGMTLYYEIVGYNRSSMIQSGYDYGCRPNEYMIYIYRITIVNPDGELYEFTSQQVKQWCFSRGLDSVSELYYGKAGEYKMAMSQLELEAHEEDSLSIDCILGNISMEFTIDKDDPMCKNKVPYEGVVIRKDNWTCIEAYKLKSDSFYLHESKTLDKEAPVE